MRLLPTFWANVGLDHDEKEMVWSGTQRHELCSVLLEEINRLDRDRLRLMKLKRGSSSWNDEQFSVKYSSLSGLVKVGRYYLLNLFRNAKVILICPHNVLSISEFYHLSHKNSR